MVVVIVATVLLGTAIVLFGSTFVIYLKAACTEPSRVREIQRLRQEGLQARQDET